MSTIHTPTVIKRKPKVITTIRLDPDIKREAQIITRNMGIDLSTFLSMRLAELVSSRRATLSLSDKRKLDDTYLTALSQKADTLESKLPTYTADEFIAHLQAL